MSEPQSNNHHRDPGPQVHRITEAQESHSVEQHSRVLKYTISMSVRLACFIAAFFVHGWLQWVFLSGAIVLPYIAVVIANGGADLSKRQPPAEFYEAGDPHVLTTGFTATGAADAPAATDGNTGAPGGNPCGERESGSPRPTAHPGGKDPSTVYEEGEIMFEPDASGAPGADATTSVPWPGAPDPDGSDTRSYPAEAPTTIDGSFVEDPQQPAGKEGHRGDGR